MGGRIVSGSWIVGLLLVLVGCGGQETATTVTETVAPRVAVRAYFLRDRQVQPVRREVPDSQAVARAAIEELLAGPSSADRALGLATALDANARLDSLVIAKGVASVEITGADDRAALAQLVYTLTQFPAVRVVAIDGMRYRRASFEAHTPPVLVESPLPFDPVSNPIRASGSANTFEATFQYEVIGPDAEVLDTHHVTATSGTGQRGTFRFTTAPYSVTGEGELVVFELSANDGARMNEVRIPIRLQS